MPGFPRVRASFIVPGQVWWLSRHRIETSYPTIAAVDARLRVLIRLLRASHPDAAPRIRYAIDELLDWRHELMHERGSSAS